MTDTENLSEADKGPCMARGRKPIRVLDYLRKKSYTRPCRHLCSDYLSPVDVLRRQGRREFTNDSTIGAAD